MLRSDFASRNAVRRGERPGMFLRSAISAAVVLAATAIARPAAAYCRTTTCPSCPFDGAGCPTGTPLFWPSSCVTFSMQYRASKQIDLPTATDVMEKAFTAWQTASCPGSGRPPAMRVDHHLGTVACTVHEYNQTDA